MAQPARVLYLHGFASGPGSRKARTLRDRLGAQGFAVEVPDLAAGDFAHLTITGQLAVIERAAADGPVAVIGSSLGGYLACLYAARHPEVTRLVLLAPAFAFPQRWAAEMGERKLARWRESGWLTVHHYGEDRPRELHYGLLADAAQYEDYPATTQPALVFQGLRDTVVPYAYANEFARLRPQVTVRLVDSGHELTDVLPQIADEAGRFLSTA